MHRVRRNRKDCKTGPEGVNIEGLKRRVDPFMAMAPGGPSDYHCPTLRASREDRGDHADLSLSAQGRFERLSNLAGSFETGFEEASITFTAWGTYLLGNQPG